MNKQIIVTTSWDDGHKLDVKLAELLRAYNLAGTFYISPEHREIPPKDRLNEKEIKGLSEDFEIGAHTMTHPHLTQIDDVSAEKEIVSAKKYLEKITGKEVKSFCYPAGFYNKKHEAMIKQSGFSLARTVLRFSDTAGNNPFALPTTVHAYRHWSDALLILKHSGLSSFVAQYLNWDELAISLFDKITVSGGVFHLWGHSWEIEKNGDWGRLERVFKHISGHSGAKYVSNRELI